MAIRFVDRDNLTEEQKKLLDAAFDVLGNAYCPYSNFRVGAAIECNNGNVFTGTNVEIANYSLTTTGEMNALTNAVGNGCREFKRIAKIGTGSDWKTNEVVPIEAGTLQCLREFSPDIEIIMAGEEGNVAIATLHDLLPFSFGKGHIEHL